MLAFAEALLRQNEQARNYTQSEATILASMGCFLSSRECNPYVQMAVDGEGYLLLLRASNDTLTLPIDGLFC